MSFSLCLSGKRPSWDLACACDALFPVPVKEKAIRNVSKKCTGTKLTDFIPSLGLYKECMGMRFAYYGVGLHACVSHGKSGYARLGNPGAERARRRRASFVSSASPPQAGELCISIDPRILRHQTPKLYCRASTRLTGYGRF